MIPSERIRQIKEILHRSKTVSIQELCDTLYCSASTIRRDLIDLEEAGVLRRTRGGATLVSANTSEFSDYVRRQENRDKKQTIAQIASDFIEDDMSIFMDSSSTVHYLCNTLYKYKNLIVITNSVLIPCTLADYENIRVFCTGGVLKQHSYSLIGNMSYEFIKNYKPDLCFLSCKALDPYGVYEADYQQTHVKKTMLANANRSILLADSSKFSGSAFISISDLEDIDKIITEREPDNFSEFFPSQQSKFVWSIE